MSVTTVQVNGSIYSLMENPLKRPKASERWLAICPAKGDGKWYAKTEKDLIQRIEEEEGGVKAVAFKPKKIHLWSSEGEFNGKPMIQWYTDGTMDVDTPSARFRIEMAPSIRSVPVGVIQNVADSDYAEFIEDLHDTHGSREIRGVITKIRLKNPDGTTLRDLEGLEVCRVEDFTTPMSLLDEFVDEILEGSENLLLSMVSAFGEDGDESDWARIGDYSFGPQEIEEAQSVFRVIDAMKFLDTNGYGNPETESSGNNHHQNSYLSTEDATRALKRLREVTDALGSIV